ncbi:MAG TPA: hypothetical protein PLC15_16440 [Candidatus Obscuribacter sp.]|nr:hypothetical protein [Candidatus Obscuribacter sp.]
MGFQEKPEAAKVENTEQQAAAQAASEQALKDAQTGKPAVATGNDAAAANLPDTKIVGQGAEVKTAGTDQKPAGADGDAAKDKVQPAADAGGTVLPPVDIYDDKRNNPDGGDKGAAPKSGDAAPKDPELNDEQRKALDEHMTKYKQELDSKNFTLDPIQKGWGPYQSLESMVNSGKIQMTRAELKEESYRIRDRDFADMGRNYYKVGEAPVRWNEAELTKKMETERAEVKQQMIKAEEERKAKEAEEAKRKEEEARVQAEQVAKAVDSNVPKVEIIAEAQKAAGMTGDPGQLRDRIKEHVTKEVNAGTLTPEDLAKPMPRVGAIYVGSGVLTGEELQAGLAEQAKRKEEAAKTGAEGPKLGDVLKDMHKDNPEKVAGIDQASKLYESMKVQAEKQRADDLAKAEADAKAKADADAKAKTEADAKAKAEADAKAKAEADAKTKAGKQPEPVPVPGQQRIEQEPRKPI